VRLAEGAEATLDGLALLDGQQVADTHSFLHHAEPKATSHQLHKCIVDGKARAVFNGQIRVAPGAQGTDARQQSRNLLLSETGRVDTKPQLDIYADDVKCSHGATVGQLDPEELFYLQSRGLDEDDARNLLTYGFAADVLRHIPVASLRRALRQLVMARTQASSLGDLS
jgi:Fe-S cluster assembly protein SufD